MLPLGPVTIRFNKQRLSDLFWRVALDAAQRRQTRSYFTCLWDTVWGYIHHLFLQSKRAGSSPAPFLTDALSTSLKNELIEFRHFHCRSPQAWRNKRQHLIFIHTPNVTNRFLRFYDLILLSNPSGSVVMDVVITRRVLITLKTASSWRLRFWVKTRSALSAACDLKNRNSVAQKEKKREQRHRKTDSESYESWFCNITTATALSFGYLLKYLLILHLLVYWEETGQKMSMSDISWAPSLFRWGWSNRLGRWTRQLGPTVHKSQAAVTS